MRGRDWTLLPAIALFTALSHVAIAGMPEARPRPLPGHHLSRYCFEVAVIDVQVEVFSAQLDALNDEMKELLAMHDAASPGAAEEAEFLRMQELMHATGEPLRQLDALLVSLARRGDADAPDCSRHPAPRITRRESATARTSPG